MTKPVVMRSKAPGACSSCNGGWRAGTLIAFAGAVWIHYVCITGARKPPKWTQHDSPETRAYLAAAERSDEFLSRRRASWR